jgi:hypothetical protein
VRLLGLSRRPDGSRDVGNDFRIISGDLCVRPPPDMVFYAGREAILPTLINYLRGRSCHEEPITVVTGSDAAALTLDPALLGVLRDGDGSAPISVVYTALADPRELAGPENPSPARPQYQAFQTSFVAQGFGAADLVDGWAIMAHDALLTAAAAIRNATGSSKGVPTAGGVRDQLYLLNSQINSVPGAGGTFQLSSTSGDPVGRPLPVFQLGPSDSPTLLELYSPPT